MASKIMPWNYLDQPLGVTIVPQKYSYDLLDQMNLKAKNISIYTLPLFF